MTDGEILLAAILDRPDEDLPRLQYADLMEEHGDLARSEFIRVQCELASGPNRSLTQGCSMCMDRALLVRRERALMLSVQANKWGIKPLFPNREVCLLALANLANPIDIGELFRRGFIEEITCTWKDWSHHADEITAQHPIRKVTLTTRLELHMEPIGYGQSRLFLGGYRERSSNFIGTFIEGEVMATVFDAGVLHEVLAQIWPKITFELPAVPPPDTIADGQGDINEFFQQALNRWFLPSN